MVGILVSSWDGLFSGGELLVSGRVPDVLNSVLTLENVLFFAYRPQKDNILTKDGNDNGRYFNSIYINFVVLGGRVLQMWNPRTVVNKKGCTRVFHMRPVQ